MQLETPQGMLKRLKKICFNNLLIFFKYFFIDKKDKERERARLSRDGEGRAPHPPTPSRDGEERATGRLGLGGFRALRRYGWGWRGGGCALRRHD